MALLKRLWLKKIVPVFLLMGCCCGYVSAQDVALGTNLFYDATTTINAGLEIGLSPKWTLGISANYNPWTFSDNKKWKHFMVQPEARYWTCNKFMGNFFGFHLLGGIFNMGNWNTDFNFLGSDLSELKDHRVEGWMAGAGVAYGYAWALARHWNLEGELGFGYAYMRYDKYKCAKCGQKEEDDQTHHYIGPTKIALSLVYLF